MPFLTAFLALCALVLAVLCFRLWRGRAQSTAAAAALREQEEANTSLLQQMQERDRLAAQIRDRERKYRSIFENTLIGIAQIAPRDSRGGGGRWLSVNPALAKMLGYLDASEILSAQPDMGGHFFVNPEDRERWFEAMQSDKPNSFEADVQRLDGKKIRVALSGAAVRDEQGNILYYEAMLFDMTERYMAERALQIAKEQAEYANRSKSDFLANMSHELRTPLNAIIGFAEIIKDQLFGPVGNTQYAEYAKDIHDSGQHLLSLINDILDMSKVEAGKRELRDEQLMFGDVAHSAVRLIGARAIAGRVKLVEKVDVPLKIRAEEKALKQVLVNLLSNAVKFTPEGGTVTLSAELRAGGDILVAVSDTGIGIAEEDIHKALAPFGQIESALARKHQGTGLGLPITKGLIELHGGEMTLTSKLGEGTTVSFTIPKDRVIRD
ncbi:MAG: ATP-binding protein [Bdellovibrionales bacterium]